jgi:hypothetical protein
MPAKDRYHDTVKRALVKDGWEITDEQITLPLDDRYLWVDIEAAKEGSGIILIEVKELDEVRSPVEAFALAIGKCVLYRIAIESSGIEAPLYLAVTQASFDNILSETIGQAARARISMSVLVFDAKREEIIRWIPSRTL